MGRRRFQSAPPSFNSLRVASTLTNPCLQTLRERERERDRDSGTTGYNEGPHRLGTAIATPTDNSDTIVTASLDNSLILWNLTRESEDNKFHGVPHRRLTGHSHFVQDVLPGLTTIQADFSEGECKYKIQDGDAHSDWVSCVRFSRYTQQPTFVSSSWDRTIKIWNLTNCKIRSTLTDHFGYVNTVAVSPDGSLCASRGKDGVILLWDPAEGKRLYLFATGSIVHAFCFSSNRYWLYTATEASIKIWNLESKMVVVDLKVDAKKEAEMNEGSATQSPGVENKVYCYDYYM
ncbi:hypothetical protein RHMOL_Rhmol07G0094300 [Rhododendron molle]|uniref:Uncharacterized protein n=1 Tax=Rhododendron molle TaxID=49168 RepID=A0ACC0MZ15_RHOML|nr:hypothetical protein RHMOL_Rhmol07G0094300 [Rhododendron molle]